MKLNQRLLLGIMLAGSIASASAIEKSVLITPSGGKMENVGTTSTYMGKWTSTATNPQIVMDLGSNNMLPSGDGFEIYPGARTNKTCTINLSTSTDGWEITGYSFDVKSTSANDGKTLTYNNGKTTITLTTTVQSIEVTGLSTTSTSMALTGNNTAATFTNFMIMVKETNPSDDPKLTVDPMPENDPNCIYKVTNKVGDNFNTFTAWYHLEQAGQFLTGANAAKSGTDGAFDDEYLYCFIKENGGYSIYNKKDGKTSLTYSNGKVMNGSSELTVTLAQQFVPVSTEYGKVYRNNTDFESTNKWRNIWKSDYTPEVTFGCTTNNLTTTGSGTTFSNTGDFNLQVGTSASFTWTFGVANGMYVYDYSFLACKDASYTSTSALTTSGGKYGLSEYKSRIEATNNNYQDATSFVQESSQNNGVTLSDVYVTIRRIIQPSNFGISQIVFKRTDRPNQRRIPAITTVNAGKHAGRLVAIYDNRPSGGDIGGGNLGLEMAFSDDNGLTWSTPDYGKTADGKDATKWRDECSTSVTPLATMQQDADKYWDCAFGDAAIVSDRETGKILMMAAAGPINFFNGRRNTNHIQCASWWSEDGGETWTSPTNRTEEILALFDGEAQFGYIDSQFIASGRMVQSNYVKVGKYYRVYAVLSSQNNGNNSNTRNWVIYTDDLGETWNVLGGLSRPGTTSNGDEAKAEELPDGSVLLAGRNKSGNRNFNIFRYTDIEKGEGRWDIHVITNMGFASTINATDGEILIVPAYDNNNDEPCYLALQSFPNSASREKVTIAYKPFKEAADIAIPSAFKTWEGSFQVTSRSSAYSTMTWQSNNTLGFFFEESQTGTYDGVYVNYSLESLTKGAYSYKADTDGAFANKLRDAVANYRLENFSVGSSNGYVGQEADPEAHKAAFEAAYEAYKKNPSVETYEALNKAEYIYDIIKVTDGQAYQMISAHDGTYNGTKANGINMDKDIYLASNGTNLVATHDVTSPNTIFVAKKTSNGNWHLYNESTNKYIDKAPALQALFTVGNEPVEFKVISSEDGHSNISCIEPTNASYPSIHLSSTATIVPYTTGAAASQWYVKPYSGGSSVGTIVKGDDDTEEIFYDILGRPINNPGPGLYITNKGRKVVIK